MNGSVNNYCLSSYESHSSFCVIWSRWESAEIDF